MFDEEEDVAAYEDELYREESSSDESIDSEVEFYLYSQVHYSQNLSESNLEEGADTERCISDKVQSKSHPGRDAEQASIITLSDSDDVLVVDSSGVITVSDTGEEDSVYCTSIRRKVALTLMRGKAELNEPDAHSTPNQSRVRTPRTQGLQGQKIGSPSSSKKYEGGIVQEILVIKGSSEDESTEDQDEGTETSESDQSDVENWMILGRKRQDGDESIQLNLEGCRTTSNEEEKGGIDWSISERDLEAQINNHTPFRRSNRYYSEDKNVICRNCDKRGHLSKNCPTPKKSPACCLCGERGHLQNSCPERYCSNCFTPGHFSRECIERAYWKKDCHRCSMTGHYADACPEIWRQYHLTVKPGPIKKSNSGQRDFVYCCNCARRGHCGYECNEKRMFNGSFPTCQLVFYYDREYEISKRNWRAKVKIEELQKVGLLPIEGGQYAKSRDDNMHPFKKMKKGHQKQTKQFHKEEIHNISKKKGFMERKPKKKKHKGNEKVFLCNPEEDFPRGSSEKSMKSRKRRPQEHSNHLFFEDGSGQQFKKRHKKRNRRKDSATVDESLFIIKQKKKKSKKGY
ncbi:zinc finger CCHC domain-containing protein 7 [Bombina bombina]|uniref:zinc finger CCHC domain-containing protein 7 n=1 Tax=Bombina bombina TaxID=8345 RepID=UPI00235ADA5D|nr:zinc finger CCHC domain-containing protein 7 [Bombina bombina]XP_053558701.1 zinc finger CCHC domain-containing protein 7 [Bombina bombina]XP_053558702.1 zinc finger CCHC domain-containing protein 7 [Bombina bombina]